MRMMSDTPILPMSWRSAPNTTPLMLVGSSSHRGGQHMGEAGQALAVMLRQRVLGLDRVGQRRDHALGALHLGHHEREPARAAQSSEELRLVEGLGQEVVRAGIEPGDDVIDRGAAGEQDHGQRHGPRVRRAGGGRSRGRPSRAARRRAGRRRGRARTPPPAPTVRRSAVTGRYPARSSNLRQEDAVRRVVLDDEDRGRRGFECAWARWGRWPSWRSLTPIWSRRQSIMGPGWRYDIPANVVPRLTAAWQRRDYSARGAPSVASSRSWTSRSCSEVRADRVELVDAGHPGRGDSPIVVETRGGQSVREGRETELRSGIERLAGEQHGSDGRLDDQAPGARGVPRRRHDPDARHDLDLAVDDAQVGALEVVAYSGKVWSPASASSSSARCI